MLPGQLPRQVRAQFLDVRQPAAGGPRRRSGPRGRVGDEPARAAAPVHAVDDHRADALVAADHGFDGVRVEGAAVGQGDPVADPAPELQQSVLAEQAEVAGGHRVAPAGRREVYLPVPHLGPAAGEGGAEQGALLGAVERARQLGQFEPGAGAGGAVDVQHPYAGPERGVQGGHFVEVEPVSGRRRPAAATGRRRPAPGGPAGRVPAAPLAGSAGGRRRRGSRGAR